MKHKIIHIFLSVVFCCCFGLVSYGQEVFPPPPEGGAYMTHTTGPCGNPLEHDEDGNPISPPPGLCMPINDYLIPLLIAGILLGAYQVHKFEKA